MDGWTNRQTETKILWVVASMVQPGLSRPRGRGRRFNSLHPRSSYSCLSSSSTISLNPPTAPPSSLFYLRLVAFCYFPSSLTRFRPLLIWFLVARIVHLVKMSFFYQRLKLLNFFPPRMDVNAESPESALSNPSNFWEIHGNPLRIFFVCSCFTNTFNRV